MVIDFSKIPAANIDGFKGGKGLFVCRAFGDDTCKIMKNILPAGASTGLHTHETNCEVIYVLSGVATCHYDDVVETVGPGQVHYCPKGHTHYMANNGTEDLVFFAIVPELR